MRLHRAKKIYSTKISTLLLRPDLNSNYPHEFMRKMSSDEIQTFLSEIRNQLTIEGICTKNINRYNAYHLTLIKDRENLYQLFKEIGD